MAEPLKWFKEFLRGCDINLCRIKDKVSGRILINRAEFQDNKIKPPARSVRTMAVKLIFYFCTR